MNILIVLDAMNILNVQFNVYFEQFYYWQSNVNISYEFRRKNNLIGCDDSESHNSADTGLLSN